MHRASIIYIAMIVACAGGLWAVLSYGSNLVPPEDLAGKWTLTPSTPAGPFIRIAPYGPGLTIDQSGRFFQVAFENGPRLDFRLAQPAELMPVPGDVVRIERLELSSPGWILKAWGKPGGDEWMMWLVGPEDSQSGRWLAKRVVRTFAPGSKGAAGTGAH
jgi:hypothetical protein